MRLRFVAAILLLAMVVVCAVSADKPIKVVSSKEVTVEQSKAANDDIKTKHNIITPINLRNVTIKQNHQKKISITVDSETRVSGGITVELFCQDNTGRFMPIWGGSITKSTSDWDFTDKNIRRSNIDGCYFAVVDSTAEMAL
jgi:hypothetical protein